MAIVDLVTRNLLYRSITKMTITRMPTEVTFVFLSHGVLAEGANGAAGAAGFNG